MGNVLRRERERGRREKEKRGGCVRFDEDDTRMRHVGYSQGAAAASAWEL